MKTMVRQPASKKAAKLNTDLKADPGYADLYIPRKEGDSTGSSKINNELATGLTAEISGEEAAAAAAETNVQMSRPIKLGAATNFPARSNINGLQSGQGVPMNRMLPVDFEAYMSGLFAEFQDPIILDYLRQDNAAPQVTGTDTKYRYANKMKESDAV